jgi:hypothetical protein
MLHLEHIQANLSTLKVDVRMEYLSDEAHLGRADRVPFPDLEIKLEPASFVGGVRGAFDQPCPVVEVIVDWLEEDVQVLGPRDLEKLLVETISGDHIAILIELKINMKNEGYNVKKGRNTNPQ